MSHKNVSTLLDVVKIEKNYFGKNFDYFEFSFNLIYDTYYRFDNAR